MSKTQTWTAIPSPAAPATYGLGLGAPTCAQGVSLTGSRAMETIAARVHVSAFGADRTTDAVPGTPAWRPPIC